MTTLQLFPRHPTAPALTAPALLILPGACDALGGTLVTLALVIQGCKAQKANVRVCVQANSIMEEYLRQAGHGDCLELITAPSKATFLGQALRWVSQQPKQIPLLLDNCVERPLVPVLLKFALALRLSGRPIYHFCHDLAQSQHLGGYVSRKLAFTLLNPVGLCNSRFTASHIQRLMGRIGVGKASGIFYQPVDLDRFVPARTPPPAALMTILASGAKLILTPSRINLAGIVNDKNLRGLIPVLAQLKAMGEAYHVVVMGEDRSPEQRNSQALLALATEAGVADCFSILPPTFNIPDYYRYADLVLTLAPREPFGRVVVEAIACGVPVLGSHTGGIGEILSQCAPQWQVDPEDAAAIARKIQALTRAPDTGQILANAQAWVRQHCSVNAYARAILAITGSHSTDDCDAGDSTPDDDYTTKPHQHKPHQQIASSSL